MGAVAMIESIFAFSSPLRKVTRRKSTTSKNARLVSLQTAQSEGPASLAIVSMWLGANALIPSRTLCAV
jgi:hypothetical protein